MKGSCRKTILGTGIMLMTAALITGCTNNTEQSSGTDTHRGSYAAYSEAAPLSEESSGDTATEQYSVQTGTEYYRDFLLDNVIHTDDVGDIHFNLMVPEAHQTDDEDTKWALHIALPGWDGLYFQGVGEDLRNEYVPFESSNYKDNLIVASVQLDSWDEKSAEQVVRLTEYLLSAYDIDSDQVYITGYSAGGETLSQVLGLRPELYHSALFVSSKWDGDMEPLAGRKTRIYLFVAEDDSYYGSEPARNAWNELSDIYLNSGLDEDEISNILVLDVRPDSWFDEEMKSRQDSMYATDYHGSGMLVAYDANVMKWVFE